MKTNTYDLNLYIIDGKLKVLAHELEISSEGYIQAGSKFISALEFPVKRSNKFMWEPILEFFDEDIEIFNELDSWWGAPIYDQDITYPDWQSTGVLESMPPVLDVACSILPTYEVTDRR
jgi:hypothetical protein